MKSFVVDAESVLRLLDRFLAELSATIDQLHATVARQSGSNGLPLSKQLSHAQRVVADRRRDLLQSLNNEAADSFIHELWSLGGDMPHFEFDLRHLQGADSLLKLREEVSLAALVLTKELTVPANKAQFIAELANKKHLS